MKYLNKGRCVESILNVFVNLIVRNVNKILASLKAITIKNLKIKSEVKSKNEIGEIAHNVNIMAEGVDKMIKEIKEMSLTVASSSKNMKASSEEVG